MLPDQKLINELKKLNFRLTPQRLAIISLLEGNTTHPSAEDIYKSLRDAFPTISLGTVYKTLEMLRDIGTVTELNIRKNRKNYDPDTKPHHHLLCGKCHRIVDLFIETNLNIEPVLKQTEHNFSHYQISFYGECCDCKTK
jgi:Fur family peroxide stress response transcriptional regulator